MQIKAITISGAGMMTAGRSVQEKGNAEQQAGNIFGPECRVTISKEGKTLSRQQETQAEKGVQDIGSERMMLRQQEEDDYYESMKNRYLEELKEIDDKISGLNSSWSPQKEMDETVEKQQEVLRAMRSQKQHQIEENQRRAKEAQQMAATQSGRYQEEIDENNREMRTLLRTIEEAKKAEEQRENGGVEDAGEGKGASDKGRSTGDVIRGSAAQFTASSVKRELDVEKMITGLSEEGHRLLDLADSITQAVLKENEHARKALEKENLTLEEMEELMRPIRERMTPELYKEVADYRGWGLQILEDTLDVKLQRIADDPLRGMEETKNSMILSAVDAAFHDAAESKLSETSEELEAEVEELIDRRNDIDRVKEEREEEKEKLEEEQDDPLEPEEYLEEET